MNIEKAKKIKGWMRISELQWIAQQAATHSNILEVGVYEGRSTRAWIDNLQENSRLSVMDSWDTEYGNGEGPIHFNTFKQNLKDKLCDITVIHGKSSSQLSLLKKEYDCIFIDAAHDYLSVTVDCTLAGQLLVPGGLLCGHDYEPSHSGLMKAVKELFPTVQNPVGTIWSVTL